MPAAGRAVLTTLRDFPRSTSHLSCTLRAGGLAWDPTRQRATGCWLVTAAVGPGERWLRVIRRLGGGGPGLAGGPSSAWM